MLNSLFCRLLTTYRLPKIFHNISNVRAPPPYFRLHIIKANDNVKRSLIDTLNAKPYRFGFEIDKLKFLLLKGHIKLWTPTITSQINIPPNNNMFLEKLIKQPLNKGVVVTYFQHIHENPVPIPKELRVLTPINDDLIAINKPLGIPVHPVQKYYYNTIHYMLAKQLNYKQEEIFPIHRLDKLTSGILLWARNKETVSKFKNKNAWNKRKTYIARIKGRLPAQSVVCDDDVVYLYPTRNMARVYPNAKTVFNELIYDESRNESIVSANLNTGYPHQIRIHLRNLGVPIIDDPLYSSTGKYKEITKTKDDITNDYWGVVQKRSQEIQNHKCSEKTCSCCGALSYDPPDVERAGEYAICLHAWRYEYSGVSNGPYVGEKHSYETTIPYWAIPEGSEDGQGDIIYNKLKKVIDD